MLTSYCQGVSVFVAVMEQITLVALEGGSCNFVWEGNSGPLTPRQKYLHVDAANSQRVFGETFHGEIEKILIKECCE